MRVHVLQHLEPLKRTRQEHLREKGEIVEHFLPFDTSLARISTPCRGYPLGLVGDFSTSITSDNV